MSAIASAAVDSPTDDERATGPIVDQYHPHALDRCGPAGEVRPSRHADGARAAGLHALEPGHALRSAGPDLAQSRSLRALERPCLDAAVVGAASDRHPGGERRLRAAWASPRSRSTTSATSASSTARRRGIPNITGSRASRPRPVRSGRASPPASAWPSPRSGSPTATTGPASRSSTTTSMPFAATAA